MSVRDYLRRGWQAFRVVRAFEERFEYPARRDEYETVSDLAWTARGQFHDVLRGRRLEIDPQLAARLRRSLDNARNGDWRLAPAESSAESREELAGELDYPGGPAALDGEHLDRILTDHDATSIDTEVAEPEPDWQDMAAHEERERWIEEGERLNEQHLASCEVLGCPSCAMLTDDDGHRWDLVMQALALQYDRDHRVTDDDVLDQCPETETSGNTVEAAAGQTVERTQPLPVTPARSGGRDHTAEVAVPDGEGLVWGASEPAEQAEREVKRVDTDKPDTHEETGAGGLTGRDEQGAGHDTAQRVGQGTGRGDTPGSAGGVQRWRDPRQEFGFTAMPDAAGAGGRVGGEGFGQHIIRAHRALDRHRAQAEQADTDQARAERLTRWHHDIHTAAGEQDELGWSPPTAGDQGGQSW